MFLSSFLAGSELPSHNLLRQTRSVSESSRSLNEYARSDLRDHRTRNSLDTSTEHCVPGSRWKNDCNSCWCSESGVAACTLMACLHFGDNNNGLTTNHQIQPTFRHTISRNSILDQNDKLSRVRRSDFVKCIPGTIFTQDCYVCLCTETSVEICNPRRCTIFRRKRSSSDTTRPQNLWPGNADKCTHGTTWMNKCNRCRCLRGHAACTRMQCGEGRE